MKEDVVLVLESIRRCWGRRIFREEFSRGILLKEYNLGEEKRGKMKVGVG
jgi:hypothetical protein